MSHFKFYSADNASITSTFQSYIQQLSYNYRVQTVNAKDFSPRIARLFISLLLHRSNKS